MNARSVSIASVLILAATNAISRQYTGTILGRAYETGTQAPVAGANVRVAGTKLGSITDADGSFAVRNVPAGAYSVVFTLVGFKPVTITDVIVRSERTTTVDAEMSATTIAADTVQVTTGYFRDQVEEPVSTTTFSHEEVRRAPGSAGDVSRILMSLPSTAQVNHNANDLVVRGGSPAENGFYVDNIRIPNINHFPVQGASGGPIGLINVDFLKDVTFLAGGFPASFGNRLSSVVDMKFRDGDRDAFHAQMDFGMQGIGGIIEGPLPGHKGSWLVSARRSYLDVVLKIMNEDVAPKYGDVHAKVTYDVDAANSLTMLDIFGAGGSAITHESAIENGEESFGSTSYEENTVGMTWRRIWSEKAYSTTSFSYSFTLYNDDWNNPDDGSNIFTRNDYERSFNVRNTNFLEASPTHRFEGGLDAEYDPSRYRDAFGARIDRLGIAMPQVSQSSNSDASRFGAFLTYLWNPLAHVTLSVGVREDFYTAAKGGLVSPRVLAQWQVNDVLSFSASGGLFYQGLPSVLLSQDRSLSVLSAIHYVIGCGYMLTSDTRLTVEVYDKTYQNLPLSPSDPFLSIIDEGRSGIFFKHYDDLVSTGAGRSWGVEFLVQKKLAVDFYGLLSLSLSKSQYRDYSGMWRDRVYDNRFIFCLSGGYRPNNNWEISARWNIAGGVPYTSFDAQQSAVLHTGIIDQTRINSVRYPDYHSLSLRVDRRFFLERSTITLYLGTLNTYDRMNIIRYYWDKVHNRQKGDYQWGFLPYLGVEYEF